MFKCFGKTAESQFDRSVRANCGYKPELPKGDFQILKFHRNGTIRDLEVPPFQVWTKLGKEGERHHFHYDSFVALWRSLEPKYPQKRNDSRYGKDEEQIHVMNMRFMECIVRTSDSAINGDAEKRAIKIWNKGIKNIKKLRREVRNTYTERDTMENGEDAARKWQSINAKVKAAIDNAMN